MFNFFKINRLGQPPGLSVCLFQIFIQFFISNCKISFTSMFVFVKLLCVPDCGVCVLLRHCSSDSSPSAHPHHSGTPLRARFRTVVPVVSRCACLRTIWICQRWCLKKGLPSKVPLRLFGKYVAHGVKKKVWIPICYVVESAFANRSIQISQYV